MNGCTIPYTQIAVDFWKVRQCSRIRLFFLSHVHLDQTCGLGTSWTLPIYCSPISKKLLLQRFPIDPSVVHELELNRKHVIPLTPSDETNGGDGGGDKMTVTLVDANHCPGAVMFFFEGYFGRILYTGDFRYSESLTSSPDFLEFASRPIDVLYVDNTFCSAKCVYPPRDEAMAQIFDIIVGHPTERIVIGLRNLGKENLLVAIADRFRIRIGVSEERFKTMELLDVADRFRIVTTTPSADSRIDVVPLMNVTRANLDAWNKECPTIAILPTALFNGLGFQPFAGYKDVFVVPYSDHSSYAELHRFVHAVHPKSVIPIVKGDVRDPLTASLMDRTSVECFQEYLDRTPMQNYHIPPAVLELMNQSSSSSGGSQTVRKKSTVRAVRTTKANRCAAPAVTIPTMNTNSDGVKPAGVVRTSASACDSTHQTRCIPADIHSRRHEEIAAHRMISSIMKLGHHYYHPIPLIQDRAMLPTSSLKRCPSSERLAATIAVSKARMKRFKGGTVGGVRNDDDRRSTEKNITEDVAASALYFHPSADPPASDHWSSGMNDQGQFSAVMQNVSQTDSALFPCIPDRSVSSSNGLIQENCDISAPLDLSVQVQLTKLAEPPVVLERTPILPPEQQEQQQNQQLLLFLHQRQEQLQKEAEAINGLVSLAGGLSEKHDVVPLNFYSSRIRSEPMNTVPATAHCSGVFEVQNRNISCNMQEAIDYNYYNKPSAISDQACGAFAVDNSGSAFNSYVSIGSSTNSSFSEFPMVSLAPSFKNSTFLPAGGYDSSPHPVFSPHVAQIFVEVNVRNSNMCDHSSSDDNLKQHVPLTETLGQMQTVSRAFSDETKFSSHYNHDLQPGPCSKSTTDVQAATFYIGSETATVSSKNEKVDIAYAPEDHIGIQHPVQERKDDYSVSEDVRQFANANMKSDGARLKQEVVEIKPLDEDETELLRRAMLQKELDEFLGSSHAVVVSKHHCKTVTSDTMPVHHITPSSESVVGASSIGTVCSSSSDCRPSCSWSRTNSTECRAVNFEHVSTSLTSGSSSSSQSCNVNIGYGLNHIPPSTSETIYSIECSESQGETTKQMLVTSSSSATSLANSSASLESFDKHVEAHKLHPKKKWRRRYRSGQQHKAHQENKGVQSLHLEGVEHRRCTANISSLVRRPASASANPIVRVSQLAVANHFPVASSSSPVSNHFEQSAFSRSRVPITSCSGRGISPSVSSPLLQVSSTKAPPSSLSDLACGTVSSAVKLATPVSSSDLQSDSNGLSFLVASNKLPSYIPPMSGTVVSSSHISCFSWATNSKSATTTSISTGFNRRDKNAGAFNVNSHTKKTSVVNNRLRYLNGLVSSGSIPSPVVCRREAVPLPIPAVKNDILITLTTNPSETGSICNVRNSSDPLDLSLRGEETSRD